jgi:surface carbohydrate biosynthesis protein
MRKIEVLWLIEYIAREMDVACAVKCLAEKRYGLQIEIKHVYLHARENMQNYQPRVVVVPWFYSSKDLAISDYVKRWPSATFFNLAWEEIFYKGHLKIKAPGDDFTRHEVVHHSWGDFFKRYLVHNGVEENNIFMNGNPAYQLYLNPYNKYYRDKEWLAQRYGLDLNKRWIIIPENYSWAFITDSKIKGRVSLGADFNEMSSMRQFARDSLRHLLKWCNDTAKHGQLEIIFRPKPVTPLNEIEGFFVEQVTGRRSAGLHFIKGESVREWILAGDVVISSFSTTLIEAAIAGKPAYMVEPLPIPESFSADWYKYVPRIRNEAELRTACLGKAPPELNSLKAWAEREMLANGDPISNLADFVYSLTQRQCTPVITNSRKINELKVSIPKIRRDYFNVRKLPYRLIYLMIYLFYGGKTRKNYFNIRTHENDAFDEEYVGIKIKEWRDLLQREKM